ncbi:hypothetical protein NLJ89_g2949 [Agrocybe chaxingu]|uniref:DUF6535 domain-containing protein n=1 Tax=Agrocybe chaxingu TaxID=84603 RepID=A0A9W8MVZ4_9AGAR|nr:hypothetical protein NLJ89_g2949 [Agrocybe chaxingu]
MNASDPPAPAVDAANVDADQQPAWIESPPRAEDPWRKCHQLVKDYDEARCGRWKDELQNLLIFAGLVSAVITAFAVETQKLLQEDPQTTAALLLAQITAQLGANTTSSGTSFPSLQTTLAPFSVTHQTLRINTLVFLSLALSLATVLFGILTLQWIREFQRKDSLSHQDSLVLRQVRFDGLVKWKVPEIVSSLPVILQLALLLFLAGLVDFLASVNQPVAIVVGVVVSLTFTLAIAATALPAFQSLYCMVLFPDSNVTQCPYKSPLSGVFFRLFFTLFSVFLKAGVTVHRSKYQRSFLLVNAKNWFDYNNVWKYHSNYQADFPLVWASRTLSQAPESFYAIYHCFRELDIREAFFALWRITGHRDPLLQTRDDKNQHIKQELLRDLLAAGFISHFADKDELSHSDSLKLHHLELYSRIMASTSETSGVVANGWLKHFSEKYKPKPSDNVFCVRFLKPPFFKQNLTDLAKRPSFVHFMTILGNNKETPSGEDPFEEVYYSGPDFPSPTTDEPQHEGAKTGSSLTYP